jgi:hypothetical protein
VCPYDAEDRLKPGCVPGWGYSWWLWQQGISRNHYRDHLTIEERVETIARYWRAVSDGWQPLVPRDQWLAPGYGPFDHGPPQARLGSKS